MTKTQKPPVLDFSVFYGTDSKAKARLVQDVRECCLNNGFFQITGHGVSRELQDRAMKCAKRFFDLPLEEKKKIDRSGHSIFLIVSDNKPSLTSGSWKSFQPWI